MSSIPGPVIVFRVSQPELQGAINPALQQIRQQAKSVSDGIAADWKRMAAQMRASVSQDAIGTKDLASSRQQLVSVLDKEIAGLRMRNELTRSELTNLKAATLERERQVDAMKRGAVVGITAGTSSAMNQVSTQTMLGVERMMDSLVNRYFGGVAGAATRTARDVSYYSAQATGVKGGGLFSVGNLAILGGVGVGALAVGGLAKAAIDGGKFAVELDNTARKLGLTTDAVIKLRSAASVLDIDFDSASRGFRKFSQELTLAMTGDLPGASKQAQEAAHLFRALGVDIKKAATDPFYAIQQLSKSFRELPDGAVKLAVANQLFGRSSQVLLPVLDKLPGAMDATRQSSQDLAKALGVDVTKSAEELKAQMVNFKNEADALEVALARHVLPEMVKFIGLINDVADAFHIANNPQDRVGGAINSALRATGSRQELSPYGQSQIADFLRDTATRGPRGIVLGDKTNQFVQNPEQALTTFKTWLAATGRVQSAFEAISDAAGSSKSGGASAKVNELAGIIGKLGESAGTARNKLYEEAARRPGRIGLTQQQTVDRLLENLIHPASPLIAPNVGGGFPSAPGGMLDFLGIGGGGNTATGNTLIESLTKKSEDARIAAIKDGVEKARAEYESDVQNFRMMLQMKQISQQQFNEAVALEQQTLNDRIAEAREKDLEKYKHEAGSLFDALVSGQKNIGKKLQSAMEEIVLAPLKESFSNAIARELQDLGDLFKPHSASTSGGASSAGGVIGRVYSKLGTIFGPLTPPTFPASGTTGTHWWQKLAGAGQSNVGTMRVNAGIVYIGGGIGSSGGLGGIGGAAGGIGGFLGDLPFTAQDIKNAQAYTGLSGAGGGPAASRSGLLGMLSKIGGVAGGAAGMFAALTSANQAGGGVGGAFKGLLGGGASGAELGATIGSIFPGLGTVLGAAIGGSFGAFAGLLSGIFGSDWSTNVQKAMTRQNYIAPSSENFSFASNGSITNTLQTGFNQTGGQFSQYGLAANTPFWANAITGTLSWQQKQWIKQAGWSMNPNAPFLGNPETNPFIGQGPAGYHAGTSPTAVHINLNLPGYIDGQGAQAALGPHLDYIAQHVAAKVSSSASGFGSNVRRAAFLP